MKNFRGFTFIELLIIIAIIGIVAAIGIPSAINQTMESRIVSRISEGAGPLSREEWVYYRDHKQKLDNLIEKAKKTISEKDKDDKDYQEYLQSF